MAKCRTFMRGLCISLNVLLLVFGIVMTAVGFSSGYTNRQLTELDQWNSIYGMLVLRVFGPVTLLLAVLGLIAATGDIKTLLLVFSVLSFVEFVALMVVAAPLIHIQAQMDSVLEEMFLNVTPLHGADPQFLTELYKLQTKESCCGLRSYSDWEEQPPSSCYCLPPPHLSSTPPSAPHSFEGPCVPVTFDPVPVWVHSEPCGPVLKQHVSFLIKVSIGVVSAFATVMMAALGLSLVLGLEEHWRRPPVDSTVDDFNRVHYKPQPALT